MKRWLVLSLIALALLLLLSPGIIGRLAERGIDESLSQVSAERDDIDIAEESFERGWFSSEGRHRVALRYGSLRELLDASYATSAPENEPALVIDTRLDHGLIPVSSMQREGGSLNPALANAVSTLSVDPGDGSLRPLPGQLYSFFGVGGDTSFRYLADAGEERVAEATMQWANVDLSYALSGNGLAESITADVAALSAETPEVTAEIEALTLDWSYEDRPDTLGDGTLDMQLRNLTVAPGDANELVRPVTSQTGIERLEISGESNVDDGELSAEGRFDLKVTDAAFFGDTSLAFNLEAQGFDAAALDALLRAYREMSAAVTADPNAGFPGNDPLSLYMDPNLQGLLQTVVTSGGRLDIADAVFSIDPGAATLDLSVEIDATDDGNFSWPTVLLNSRGTIEAAVAESLYDALVELNPQARGALASGMLIKDGDQFVMDVEFDKGRLLINGAPMSLPIGLPR